MSEQAPRSNSRLDNFDANKAAFEQEAFERKVYGNAGTTLFNDRARRRVEEGAAYEAHMEQFAADERSAYDRGLDRLESGEIEGAYEREHEAAIAENEAFDAAKAAHEDEIAATIAATPELRRMQAMARDIAELKNRQVTSDNADTLVARLKDKEDKLNDLLVAYSETDTANEEIIDRIIDSTEAPAETSAAAATSQPEAAAPAPEIENNDVAEATTATTATERPAVDTDWADEAAESDDSASQRPEVDTSWADSAEESTEAPVVDVPERPAVDTSWVDEATPDDATVVERPIVDTAWADEAEQETAPREKFSWLRHPFIRAGHLYQTTVDRVSERSRSKETKRGTKAMTIAAIGAIATVGAVTAWKLGAFDGLFGHHGAGIDPNNLPPSNGGSHGGTPEVPPATPKTPSPEHVNFPAAAHNVHASEGWYETFNDMNIPQSEWSNLLDKVGPELHDHGWAYKMSDGSWGISHPGNLPQDMLELIQKNR